VTNSTSLVLCDPELVEVLGSEPELLALADAYEATQRRHWKQRRSHRPFVRVSLVATVLVAIAVPAVAFADQIGSLIGLYNHGTPVPASVFANPWAAALVRDPTFGNGEVRQVGQSDDVTFYAAKNESGNYCVGIGFAVAPSIDALTCGAAIDTFVSGTSPIEDFSSINSADGTTFVTRLAGFANDQAARISILAPDGTSLYSTPAVNGLYAANDLPQQPAEAIVALDPSGRVIFRRNLIAPPVPQPAMP
jgi:hypothetical protein